MTDIVQKCRVCHGLIDEEDLFCSNCGASTPDDRPVEQFGTVLLTHQFECQGCGGSMSYDARSQALRCPYCGSQELKERQNSSVWAPQRVVPFQLSTNEAETALRAWLGRGWWRPGDLRHRAAVAQMAPVYVPYWLFSARTHTYWNADVPAPLGARGDWQPVSGEHFGQYEGLLVGGSATLTPDETEAICPFDMSSGQQWGGEELSRVMVEPCTVPRKYARPLARRGLETNERSAIVSRYLSGRSRNVKLNMRIEHLTSQPVLLPVWVMVYHYKGQPYRFLINGQTGKATGQAPWSKWKLAGLILVLVAIVLAVILLSLLNR